MTSHAPADGKWSLIRIEGSTGRRAAYRQVGVLFTVTATMTYTYYPASDWRSGRVFSVTNAAGEVTRYAQASAVGRARSRGTSPGNSTPLFIRGGLWFQMFF